jgi:hypothetical protein
MAEFFRDLLPGVSLNPGDVVFSATRSFKLVFQTDGNLVYYVIDDASLPADITAATLPTAIAQASYSRPVWATDTNGMGANRCVMQGDGNLVLYGNIGAPRLGPVPPGQAPPPGAGLGSNSNYYMYGLGRPLLDVEVNVFVREQINLASVAAAAVWASGTNGNPGAFLRCQDDGNLVILGPGGAVIASSHHYAGMG